MFLNCKQIVFVMLPVELFSSAERLRLIEKLFYVHFGELRVRAIAREAKVSPALVSDTIEILRRHGLLKDGKVDFLHPSVRALKIMLNAEKLESIKIAQKAGALFKGCAGIGLYGSWANGTNTNESDLDLWIKSEDEGEEKITKIRRFLKEKLGLEANVILLTKKRLKELKEKDFVFYCMLYNSFLLWGEGL